MKSEHVLFWVSGISLLAAVPALAGNEKGNGDLAHVCRTRTGIIVRDDVLDLYRGTTTLGLKIPESDDSIDTQLAMAIARLSDFADLYNFTLDYFPDQSFPMIFGASLKWALQAYP